MGAEAFCGTDLRSLTIPASVMEIKKTGLFLFAKRGETVKRRDPGAKGQEARVHKGVAEGRDAGHVKVVGE